jgi:ATP phosphoribosyltransferase regulatory subunit
MSSAWLLPEHIADVLPAEARRVEELRRRALRIASTYGFELVIPPLLEHLESLLSGTGRALDLRTFKLIDQLSGRSLGLRADCTPQVARIDAHLLNRQGVTRLCYCGPVLHTRPAGLHASREPLQLGAEIYGHSGLEADLEVQELALHVLRDAGITGVAIDLGDARILRALLAGVVADPQPDAQPSPQPNSQRLPDVASALAAKDPAALAAASSGLPVRTQQALVSLLDLYGGHEVLAAAREVLPASNAMHRALDDLAWLAAHLKQADPSVRVGFDLSDLTGYAYYSGVRFAVYGGGSRDTLARGGRYDEVGAVFGRNRPAAGFSTDLKALAGVLKPVPPRAAIRAPWGEDAALRTAIRALRDSGETVVCVMPGHEHEAQEFSCDRELVLQAGQWMVRPSELSR